MTRPSASSELIREQMSRQKTANTKPEIAVRRGLHRRGLRFRVHQRIGKAKPDILLTRARIAVFVMGDFWHNCPQHGTRPKRNGDWWSQKLDANKERDLRQKAELEALGWRVEWIWECEDVDTAVSRLVQLWEQRRQPPAR